MKSRVFIHNTVPGARLPRKSLSQLGELVLGGEEKPRSVNLVIISDEKMREINHRFRGRNKSTDVLSFPLADEADTLIGEVYISLPEARRRARLLGEPLQPVLLRLFCHGLLHLCGFDHPDAEAREHMEGMEDLYLLMLTERMR